MPSTFWGKHIDGWTAKSNTTAEMIRNDDDDDDDVSEAGCRREKLSTILVSTFQMVLACAFRAGSQAYYIYNYIYIYNVSEIGNVLQYCIVD